MDFFKKPYSKLLLIVSALLVLLLLAFSYGVMVGKDEIFPYRIIKALKMKVSPRPEPVISDFIETNLLVLSKKTFNELNPDKFVGYGGGLAKIGNKILGVDKDGNFFLYIQSGIIKKLDISIQTNKDILVKYLSEPTTNINKYERKIIERYHQMFRLLGIAVKEKDKKVHIFVAHNYWYPDKLGKTMRVSRLIVDNIYNIFEGKEIVDADEWEVIYESKPIIPFNKNVLSFRTNRSAGRIIFDTDSSLIVGFGDQELDGYSVDVNAVQDENSSYGKLIRIDLKTLEAKIYSRGVRNPQGLFIDRDGNIWETEHGPRGGDELNLINENKNYGWPSVSYGTQYGMYDWPPNKEQGRHKGFERPIYAWVPSIGISNVMQVNNIPQQWDGDLLVSSLKQATLYRMRIHDRKVILAEPIKIGERIRDLIQMNDGTILIWTDNAHIIELGLQQQSDMLQLPLTKAEIDIGLDEVIQSCSECHSFSSASVASEDAASLYNIYGREMAASNFAGYSESLKKLKGVWNKKTLKAYLDDPQQFAPGTTMPDPAIDDTEQLEALLEYLKNNSSK